MLTIKVRAYDTESEYMFYSHKPEDEYFFQFNDAGELRGYVIRPPRSSSNPMEPPEPYCDDYPVDQHIGCEDKHGVEIWKNDIMCSPDGLRKFIVSYSPKETKWYLHGIGPAWCDNTPVWDEYEVIGSIYATPELLKAK